MKNSITKLLIIVSLVAAVFTFVLDLQEHKAKRISTIEVKLDTIITLVPINTEVVEINDTTNMVLVPVNYEPGTKVQVYIKQLSNGI